MGGIFVVGVDIDIDDLVVVDEVDGQVEEFVDIDCKELCCLVVGGKGEMSFKVRWKEGVIYF